MTPVDDPALEPRRCLAADGSLAASPRVEIAPATRRELYRHVRRLRGLDQELLALQRQGRIGFYGSTRGQEAPPVAAALAARASDWVFPALRESALLLVRGFPLERYLAQHFGSRLDPMKGRQMPSHVASRAGHVVSWSSSIGTQLPHAVGAALAARRGGGDHAVLAFLGDGATSHPDFHAALNFAGVWRAPVVFVCQNNHYAISVPVARQTASATLAVKARAYGFDGERVDGNDALAVYEVLRLALENARAGLGPELVECVTYRLGPHSSSDDPSRYRAEDEVLAWQERDPVALLRRHLEREGLWSDAEEAAVERELARDVARAVALAETEPPARESLFDDVYAVLPWHLREQRRELALCHDRGDRLRRIARR